MNGDKELLYLVASGAKAGPSPFRRYARWFAALLALWSIPGAVTFFQHMFLYADQVPDFSHLENAFISFGTWYFCVFATPIVYAGSRRFPVRSWRTLLIVHLPASFAFAYSLLLWNTVLSKLIFPEYSIIDIVRSQFIFSNLTSVIYWLILGCAHAAIFYDEMTKKGALAAELASKNAKLQLHLSNARLDALKMQLQPHFLFNSLHTVSAMMDISTDRARDMIVELSDLLRIVLDRGEQNVIPLSMELEWLRKYLKIESERFSDRLTTVLNVEDEALNVEIPPFILQPLVENALRHGIEASVGPCKLAVDITVDDDQLLMRVTDTGPGKKLAAKAKQGVGVANDQARNLQQRQSRALASQTRVPDLPHNMVTLLTCRWSFLPVEAVLPP